MTFTRALLAPAAGVLLAFASVAVASAQAPVCERGVPVDTIELGVPTSEGTVRQERLDSPADSKAFRFLVTEPGSGFVYVGDQWYDLDMAVFSVELNRSIACWTTTGAKARSERSQTRQLQLIRPDEQVIRGLTPGVYVLVAGPDYQYVENPGALSGFDPNRQFTIRVAVNPVVCGVSPAMIPHPRAAENAAYQGLEMRADDAWYQVAMNYQPLLPTANSLMTFQVTASPPYNDLFDFQWFINGQPVPGATDLVFQAPATQFAQPGGQGRVAVKAQGARTYPDPDQPHVPLDGGSLIVECPVLVR
jgi:hypothetical protein